MKVKHLFFYWLCIFWVAGCLLAETATAEALFKGRHIHLNNPENRTFRIGIKGTTAGYNFIALVENAKEEAVPIGKLGYWEKVPDPPSFLRNYDLQLIIRNHTTGKFQIEFEYDEQQQKLRYRVTDGAVLVKLDAREYYPVLIIDNADTLAQTAGAAQAGESISRMILFDFNSFDVDLREHYGKVKHLISNPAFKHYFYYYEAANYNSYYFKIYQEVSQLDIEKMGLSSENATLPYYQKVIENLKSRLGSHFADQVIIVSRFGRRYSNELRKYAAEIGLSRKMEISFWSYNELETQ